MFIEDKKHEIIIDHFGNNTAFIKCMLNLSEQKYQLILTDNEDNIIIVKEMIVNGSKVIAI